MSMKTTPEARVKLEEIANELGHTVEEILEPAERLLALYKHLAKGNMPLTAVDLMIQLHTDPEAKRILDVACNIHKKQNAKKKQHVLVECEINDGIFHGEKSITVYDKKGAAIGSAFVDKTLIKKGKKSYVRAIVIKEESQLVLVTVPEGFIPTTSVWVPREKIHFI